MRSGQFDRTGIVAGAMTAVGILLILPGNLLAQEGTPEHLRRQYLLDWAWEKVQEDSDKVVELARMLGAEIKEDTLSGMPEDIRERVEALGGKAEELDEAVRSVSKSQLSIKVVTLAEQIEDEGKALEKLFKKLSPAWRRNKFRDLANELRKKAASVKNRMRTP